VSLPPSAELVVIGGGIVGAATAFFAQQAGLRCVVLEKRPALCTLTTPVSTGAFRLQFDNPEEIALVREGIALFEAHARDWDLRLQQSGYLFCATTEAAAARERHFVGCLHDWGVTDVELLSGDEARYRFPYLSPEVIQARFRAGDGWLDPKRLTLGYARASGATVCLESPAVGFEREGDRVVGVRTPSGSIACEAVVIAAGPFSGALAALAGLRLDLRPTIRQKMIVPHLAAIPNWAPMTIEAETAAHWRPWGGGCYALWTDAAVPPGPPLEEVPTSSRFAFELLDPASPHALARISPFWREVWADGTFDWALQAGQYTYTPDHRPLLGPSGLDGLYLNTGYSGHGIMASAGGSRLVVDSVLGRLAPADNPFRPDRPMVERPFDIL
jgi:glycine/D-amino acid oxidase-like deaminating enzyme